MANFGESLTFWYLRLNGFFPLTNFVLHRSDELQHSADADLLAVRFKHVYEPVGGQEEDWDDWFLDNGLNLKDRVTGLIVEVKTGSFSRRTISNSFSSERLHYAVARFGFYRDQSMIDRRVSELTKRETVTSNRYRLAKVLVSNANNIPDGYPPCLHLPLRRVERFIANRMRSYAQEKSRDRMCFPDDLVQYFAWKAQIYPL